MLRAADYLERIGFPEAHFTPDVETLRRLHRAHLFSVPFENLDIAWGRAIPIDEDRFLQKIIDERRGGFCYELNGAFAALLRALGYRVTLLSARVPREDGSDGPEFDHLTLRVDLDEPWLADVGFGDSFLEPLRLNSRDPQVQGADAYRVMDLPGALRVVSSRSAGAWKTEYDFTLQPRSLQDFADMCRYHQTSPESPFTRKRICSLPLQDGRITLSDMRLIRTRKESRDETALSSQADWRAALKQHFGIEQPDQDAGSVGRGVTS